MTFVSIYYNKSKRERIKLKESIIRRLHVSPVSVTNWIKGATPNAVHKAGLSAILKVPIDQLFPMQEKINCTSKSKLDDLDPKMLLNAIQNMYTEIIERCEDKTTLLLLSENVSKQICNINEGLYPKTHEDFQVITDKIQKSWNNKIISTGNRISDMMEFINCILPLQFDAKSLNIVLHKIQTKLLTLN